MDFSAEIDISSIRFPLSLLATTKHSRVVVFKTDLLAFPQTFYTRDKLLHPKLFSRRIVSQTFHFRLPCSKCAKEPVKPNVLCSIVAANIQNDPEVFDRKQFDYQSKWVW